MVTSMLSSPPLPFQFVLLSVGIPRAGPPPPREQTRIIRTFTRGAVALSVLTRFCSRRKKVGKDNP